jgi:hypothetical protein
MSDTSWKMFVLKGTNLPADIVLANVNDSDRADIRIYSKNLSDNELAFLYDSIKNKSGDAVIPGDIQ